VKVADDQHPINRKAGEQKHERELTGFLVILVQKVIEGIVRAVWTVVNP